MAAGDVTIKVGTPQLRWFVTGSFSPADAATNMTVGTPTDFAMTSASLADGAGRQSIKGDIGSTWAEEHEIKAAVDFTLETPAASGSVDYYWASSGTLTQANDNIAGNSGADAACPDGALGSITLAEFLLLCDFIGSLPTHDGASVQNGIVNPRYRFPSQFGQLIEVNKSGDAFEADDVEHHVVATPRVRNTEQ